MKGDARMGKVTLEQLKKWNARFESAHFECNESDLVMANSYIDLIEKSRSKNTPVKGDVVRFTNEYGKYYSHALVEWADDDEVGLCEQGNPSIGKSDSEIGFFLSISGGSFPRVPLNKMKLIGKTKTRFWDFGHCGACKDGGIDFFAEVNLWECDINEQPYSTKNRDMYHITYSTMREDTGYKFFATKDAMSSCAWKNEGDLQDWLRTNRASITNQSPRQMTVWTYKETVHHCSPAEYESVNAPEDVMCMNGHRRCKRIYDDENSVIHVYYVWYWEDDSMGDFYERSVKQNEIRKQYECNWLPPINQVAHNELKTGKVKPLDIRCLFKKYTWEE